MSPKKIISEFLKKLKENPLSAIVIPAFIFILALLPRILYLGTGLTTDETAWIQRAPSFIDALIRGDFIHTYTTAHPGVTTMWISGIFLKFFSHPGMDFYDFLTIARLPVAIITSVGIVLMFFLLKKILNEKIAVIASVFIALDPFYLAHSRFIHLDALVTTFMVLAVLSFLLYLRKSDKKFFLIVTGIFSGLALLTKQPALFLLPYFLLVLILWELNACFLSTHNLEQAIRKCISTGVLTKIFKLFISVFCIAGLVFVILFPAMWVAPLNTATKLTTGLESVVENPHENFGFFLGQVITTDQYGPLFYPVVVLMKTTPLVLIFSIVCLASLLFSYRKGQCSKINLIVILLVLYIVAFCVMMTLGEKKGDRYILPVFPVIDILAGIGIYYCYEYFSRLWDRNCPGITNIVSKFNRNILFGIMAIVIVLFQAALIIPIAPYYLSYSNPIVLGGAVHSPEIIGVGWGDGQDLAAAYLNAKPDARNLTVAVQYLGFSDYFKGKTVMMGKNLTATPPDYLVFYICVVQRHYNSDIWDSYRNETPEKVIVINNIEYCWIYPVHQNQTAGT